MPDISVVLSDDFPVLSLTLITEPLRVANRELARPLFTWRLVSEKGGRISSSSGFEVDTAPLDNGKPDALILLTSYGPDRSATGTVLAWLRRMDRAGCLMGCVDTGALVFARAGLLNRRPAAAHHEAIVGFAREFPGKLFVDRRFDFAPPRFSSAGGIATADMTLALIAHFAAPAVATRVAAILNYAPPDRTRTGSAPASADRLEAISPVLAQAVDLMRTNLSSPLEVSRISLACGVPGWKLTRLFKRHLHHSPAAYYLSLRLDQAQDMLRNSSLSVGDIASECGYDNIESFSRSYKTRHGRPPSRDRSVYPG